MGPGGVPGRIRTAQRCARVRVVSVCWVCVCGVCVWGSLYGVCVCSVFVWGVECVYEGRGRVYIGCLCWVLLYLRNVAVWGMLVGVEGVFRRAMSVEG